MQHDRQMITVLGETYDVQDAELKNEILVLVEEFITAGLVEVSPDQYDT